MRAEVSLITNSPANPITVVELTGERSPAAPGTPVVVYAINSGGGAFTAADGTNYQEDAFFNGGFTFSVDPFGNPIAGTLDDTLYQSERFGGFSYDLPIANGTYEVTLQFAEIFFTSDGGRIFDANAEGAIILPATDIHAEVGADAAFDQTFIIEVTDGELNIGLNIIQDNAKISALVVRTIPEDPVTPPAPTEPQTIYAINAGGDAFTDSNGTLYQADAFFDGGFGFSTGDAITGTLDDVLYQSERFGQFNYNLPIENGSYELTLRFAEIFFTTDGARLFTVIAEGQEILPTLDIHAQAGPDTAFDQTFTVEVLDGELNLEFIIVQDNAKLSALLVEIPGTDPGPPPAPEPISAFVGNDQGSDFFYKIQIEDPNGEGVPEILDGTNQSFIFVESGADNDTNNGEDGEGYFVFTNNINFVVDQIVRLGISNDRQIFNDPNENNGANQLTYRIYVPEDQVGDTFNFRFRTSRDAENFDTSLPAPPGGEQGDPGNGAVIEEINGELVVVENGRFSNDTQNDLRFSINSTDGTFLFEELLTNEDSDSDIFSGFGRIAGGPTNSNFGFAGSNIVRGGNDIVFPEAGFYDFTIAGRAVGYHIDFFTLFREEGGLPPVSATDSAFLPIEDNTTPNPGPGSEFDLPVFVTPTAGDTFTAPVDVSVTVEVPLNGDVVDFVQLFLDGELVRQENNAPYNWNTGNLNDEELDDLAPAVYELRVVATYEGGFTTEAFQTVVVSSDQTPPNLEAPTFVTPLAGENFIGPVDVQVTVDVPTNGDTVDFVRLFINGEFIRQENNPPYNWNASTNTPDAPLDNLAPGQYELQVFATYEGGFITEATQTFTVSSDDPAPDPDPDPTPDPEPTNLALGQPTTQSSTSFGGVPSRAVDGNTSGIFNQQSVTHTTGNNPPQPWWQVDLGQLSDIDSIQIWNRTDGTLGNRLSDFSVFLTEEDPTGRTLNDLLNDSSVFQFTFDGAPGQTTDIPVNTTGRFVRVQLPGSSAPLSLAEVIVIGVPAQSDTTPNPTPTPTDGEVIYAINAGGSAFTAADGTEYQEDAFFDGGFNFSVDPFLTPIAGTTDDTLYVSERFGQFGYDLPIENGTYAVTFQFAEIFFTFDGGRLFTVNAEGSQVLDTTDIHAEVGPNAALDQTVTVEVTDGTLNLDFLIVQDNAKLSALVVREIGAATQTAPAISNLAITTMDVNASTVTLNFTAAPGLSNFALLMSNDMNEFNSDPSLEVTFTETSPGQFQATCPIESLGDSQFFCIQATASQ